MIKIGKKSLAALSGILLILLTGQETLKGQDDKNNFSIGGAMRYNLIHTDYKTDANAANPSMMWDTWFLEIDGSRNGIDLSFEYRFYPNFGTHFIHHGYWGYGLGEDIYMKLGVTQVPFGIMKEASHTWWFQGPYYAGLENDYDMGINFDFTPMDKLKFSFSYFLQQEPETAGTPLGYEVTSGNAGPGRYSYDVVPDRDPVQIDTGEVKASLRELNQFNLRVAYNVTENWEIGGSAQVGQLYNSKLDESDWTTAYAAHLEGDFGGFNLKTEYIRYDYSATYDNGKEAEKVNMGAYSYSYPVAAKASMYVAGLSYSIPVEWGPVTNIRPYVDYTLVDKFKDNFYNTQHLVPGFLIDAGSIYTYVDYAMGKNHPRLTDTEEHPNGLGRGYKDADWNTRININIGYYF